MEEYVGEWGVNFKLSLGPGRHLFSLYRLVHATGTPAPTSLSSSLSLTPSVFLWLYNIRSSTWVTEYSRIRWQTFQQMRGRAQSKREMAENTAVVINASNMGVWCQESQSNVPNIPTKPLTIDCVILNVYLFVWYSLCQLMEGNTLLEMPRSNLKQIDKSAWIYLFLHKKKCIWIKKINLKNFVFFYLSRKVLKLINFFWFK